MGDDGYVHDDGGGRVYHSRKSHLNMKTDDTLFDTMYEGKAPADACCGQHGCWYPHRWLDQGTFEREYTVKLAPHMSQDQFDDYRARLNLAVAPHRATLVDDDITGPACKLGFGTSMLLTAYAAVVLWPITVCCCYAAYQDYDARYVPQHSHLIARVKGTIDIINDDLRRRGQPIKYEMYVDNVQLTAFCNNKTEPKPENTYFSAEDNRCHGKVMSGVRVQLTAPVPGFEAPSIEQMGGPVMGAPLAAAYVPSQQSQAVPYGQQSPQQSPQKEQPRPMSYSEQQQRQQNPQQQPQANAFCSQCGRPAPAASAFCGGCGAHL
jgi:hypothetical protein